MSTGQSPRRQRRASLVPIMALVGVTLIFSIVATSLVPGLVIRAQQQRELARVQTQLAAARAENGRLKEEVARLKDPAYLELIARSRYNLTKPGERLFNVIDVPAPSKPPSGAAAPKASATPWWTRAWTWLAGG